MKKFLFLFILCFSLTVFSFIPGKDDFKKVRELKIEPIDSVEEITINVKESNVNILLTKEKEVSALWQTKLATAFGFDQPELRMLKKDNKLDISIFYGEKYDFLSNNIVLRDPLLTVKIPENYINSLVLNSISGDISLPSLKNTEIKVENISGDIRIEEIDSEKIWIRNTTGKIDINSLKGINSRIINVSGTVFINRLFTKNTFMKTTGSDIMINEVDSYCEISAVSSTVRVNSILSGNTMNISTISGDIVLKTDDKQNKEFSFSTISGNIDCSIEHVKDKQTRFSYKGHYMAGTTKRHSTILVSTVSGNINFRKSNVKCGDLTTPEYRK